MDYSNGELKKKRKRYVLPSRLAFLGRPAFRISVLAAVVAAGALTGWLVWQGGQLKREMTAIEFHGVRLFMTREEVGKLHGAGRDKTAGCFGCEMNFIYPRLKLAGRYSETLGMGAGSSGRTDRGPMVKTMTTADPAFAAFGVRVGDPFAEADRKLTKRGFRLSASGERFEKGNYYVKIKEDRDIAWLERAGLELEEDDTRVRSLTVGYRVAEDEQIQY
ncbi:hypothetical protein ACF3MZ_09240 [Paenibacillaceae bacterium WGS1546]|uniref:hypothetical protein n=1 Tax=Cohnella sp. WGS1546 TaxID=3366810 RepID=UPI00372D6363